MFSDNGWRIRRRLRRHNHTPNHSTSTIEVTFEVGTDIDMANVLVQNKVSEAEPGLPEEVKQRVVVALFAGRHILFGRKE